MAKKGKGARFWLWDATLTTPALRKVGEVLSVTPPAQTRDTIDTTHHESSGDYREFIANLADAGEATILISHTPGSVDDLALQAAFSAGVVIAFAIDLNAATGQRRTNGAALITNYAPADVVIDDKMTATLTVKVSGPLTFAVSPA